MINSKSTTTILLLLFPALLFLNSCDSGNEISSEEVNFTSNIDSVSYAFGYVNGNQLRQQGMSNLDARKFAQGLKRALEDNDSQIDRSTLMSLLQQYQIKANKRKDTQMKKEGAENRKKANEFLRENKDKEGINVTESGLQYKVLEKGSGATPTAEDTVSVHYEGTLIDGTVFDSSYERDKAATFPLNRVIPGWTEGLQLMQEGATYRFYIPGELAYGKNPPQGSDIGPDETLIFKVELLEVK